jgi:hypothetical protein
MKNFRSQRGVALIQALFAMSAVAGFLFLENMRKSKAQKIVSVEYYKKRRQELSERIRSKISDVEVISKSIGIFNWELWYDFEFLLDKLAYLPEDKMIGYGDFDISAADLAALPQGNRRLRECIISKYDVETGDPLEECMPGLWSEWQDFLLIPDDQYYHSFYNKRGSKISKYASLCREGKSVYAQRNPICYLSSLGTDRSLVGYNFLLEPGEASEAYPFVVRVQFKAFCEQDTDVCANADYFQFRYSIYYESLLNVIKYAKSPQSASSYSQTRFLSRSLTQIPKLSNSSAWITLSRNEIVGSHCNEGATIRFYSTQGAFKCECVHPWQEDPDIPHNENGPVCRIRHLECLDGQLYLGLDQDLNPICEDMKSKTNTLSSVKKIYFSSNRGSNSYSYCNDNSPDWFVTKITSTCKSYLKFEESDKGPFSLDDLERSSKRGALAGGAWALVGIPIAGKNGGYYKALRDFGSKAYSAARFVGNAALSGLKTLGRVGASALRSADKAIGVSKYGTKAATAGKQLATRAGNAASSAARAGAKSAASAARAGAKSAASAAGRVATTSGARTAGSAARTGATKVGSVISSASSAASSAVRTGATKVGSAISSASSAASSAARSGATKAGSLVSSVATKASEAAGRAASSMASSASSGATKMGAKVVARSVNNIANVVGNRTATAARELAGGAKSLAGSLSGGAKSLAGSRFGQAVGSLGKGTAKFGSTALKGLGKGAIKAGSYLARGALKGLQALSRILSFGGGPMGMVASIIVSVAIELIISELNKDWGQHPTDTLAPFFIDPGIPKTPIPKCSEIGASYPSEDPDYLCPLVICNYTLECQKFNT